MQLQRMPAPDADAQPPAYAELEQLFARYQAELLGTLYCLLGNADDAREGLQETFLKCWRRRELLAEIENLKAWVFRIAVNTGRDLRSTAWRRKRTDWEVVEAMATASSCSPQAELEHSEELSRLRNAVMRLRPEEQEVFLLRQNGSMTYDQIAVAVGIPIGTVKTRMRLALEKLRSALASE